MSTPTDQDSKQRETAPPLLGRAFRPFRREQKKQRWESLKDKIFQLYVAENKTLKETMREMEDEYSLKASERTWKDKLDAWQFEKNLSAKDMRTLLDKKERRLREEGKDTQFHINGLPLRDEKLRKFKRRKTTAAADISSKVGDPATPTNITYNTPKSEDETTANSVGKETLPSPQVMPANIAGDTPGPDDQTTENSVEEESLPSVMSMNIIHNSPGHRIDAVGVNMEEEFDLRRILRPHLLELTAEPLISLDSNRTSEHVSEYLNYVKKRYPLLNVGESHLWASSAIQYRDSDSELRILIASAVELSVTAVSNVVSEQVEKALSERDYVQAGISQLMLICVIVVYSEMPNSNEELLQKCISALLEIWDLPSMITFLRDETISTYRQLLILFMKTHGQWAKLTLTASHLLASSLRTGYKDIPYFLKEAEDLYKFAAMGFKKLGQHGEQLDCQLSLGLLMLDGNRLEEGALLLAASISNYLGQVSPKMGHSTESSSLPSSFSALRIVSSPPRRSTVGDKGLDTVRTTVAEIQTIIKGELGARDIHPDEHLFAMDMLQQTARLGAGIVSLPVLFDPATPSIFYAAELIFRNVMLRIEALHDIFWRAKVSAYLHRGMYYSHSRMFEQCVEDMSQAYETMKEKKVTAQDDLIDLFRTYRASVLEIMAWERRIYGIYSYLYKAQFETLLLMDPKDFRIATLLYLPDRQKASGRTRIDSTSTSAGARSAGTGSTGTRSTGNRSTGNRSDGKSSVGSNRRGVTYSEGSISGISSYSALGI